jgi:hypothetical protein
MVISLPRSFADSTNPNTDRLTRYAPAIQSTMAAMPHIEYKMTSSNALRLIPLHLSHSLGVSLAAILRGGSHKRS